MYGDCFLFLILSLPNFHAPVLQLDILFRLISISHSIPPIGRNKGGELGYSGDASPHKSHQIPLDKTGSGSIMDPPARGATA